MRPNLSLPRTPLLSDEECRQLLVKAQEGDKEAQDKLVESNLRLVYSIAERFSGTGYELDDIFQIGCIGLLKAIAKFNMDFEVKFSTYAVPVIIGEIRQFLRDDGLVKIGRSMREKGRQISRFREEYVKSKGHEPTTAEIAEKFNLDRAEVALLCEANKPAVSLFEVVSQGDDDPIYLIDQVSEKPLEYEELDKMALRDILPMLNDRFQLLLNLRFFEGKTQNETAKILKISQVQVCRLEKAAICKIREILGG